MRLLLWSGLRDCSKEMIARLKVTGPSRSTTSFGLTCFPTSYSHLLFIPGSRGLADMPEPFWNQVRKLLFSDCETKQDWSLVAVMAPNPNTARPSQTRLWENLKYFFLMWSQGAAHELVIASAKENCFQLPTQTLQAAGWAHQRFQVGFPEKKARFTKDISRNGCEIL